jgi:uncharacterized protein
MNQQTIDEDDLDFIDTILEKYGDEDSILNASELDGFLTAIVSGPDMIMPSEWLPAIWGDEDASPEWESEAEVSRFMNLVMTMMNQNVGTLIDSPEDFEAMFLMDMEDGKPVTIVTPWCHGYLSGVMLRADSWANLPNDIEEHLNNIAVFCSFEDVDSPLSLGDETIEELQEKIDPAARAIHAYWLQQRAHLASGLRRGSSGQMPGAMPMGQVLPFVRQQPKIGPNAPCPCGSGKKYKKCCGAH